MSRSIVERAQEGLVVCEGAMGSQLTAKGVVFRNTGEANLGHLEVVAEIHREYQEAGAEIFQTNTFAANLLMLERSGLAEQAAAIQTAAVQILREAVGPEPLVGIDLGPTGHLIEPLGDISREQAVACYRQQLEVMLAQAVDFVLFETFEALEEVEAGVEAARNLNCQLPLVVTMSFSSPKGTTMMGLTGAQVARELMALGVDVMGANCGRPEGLRTAIAEMAELTDRPLMAQANAGVPELVGGQTVYRQSPEQFGKFAQRLIEMGVRIIGGCCGTTPQHIRQLRRLANAEA